MIKIYEIILMRGDNYYIKAISESQAYKLCKETYPEMIGADVLDIKEVKEANI